MYASVLEPQLCCESRDKLTLLTPFQFLGHVLFATGS